MSTSELLDRELARYTDEVERWSLWQLAAIYAAVDLAALDASFAFASPRLSGLYAQTVSAMQQAVAEYLALKGSLGGMSVVHDWHLTRLDAGTRLPSGQPVARYFANAPYGVKSLIARRMPPRDALRVSQGRSSQALATIPHLTVRQFLANAALAENTAGVEWPAMSSPPQTAPRVRYERPVPPNLMPWLNDVRARQATAPPARELVDTPELRQIEDFANTGLRPPSKYLTDDGLRVRQRKARWRRVPSPGACDFCLTLASRGAVYSRATVVGVGKSTKSSRRATIQENGGRYHYRCRCRAVVDYEGLPDLIISREDWKRLSTRDADGNLPTFGIRRWRYTIESFDYAVYDGPEPPFPRWVGK